ncbi:MAG: hypothetical protein QMO91_01330 [Candidatus Tisiphia sp.]|nr:hypothetical protein [Candidatus Tisiphia sp.]
MQLRQESINKIESDPTRYIASNVREVCGSGALLEGGRRNQSIESNNYPSHQNKIKVVEKHKKVLAKLRNDFNEHKNEVDKFTGKKETEKLTYMKHNKSIQQFGSNPKKEEMMMGVLEVTFTNGTKFQIATVSGDEPFSVRSSVSDNNNLSYKLTPIPFVNEYDGLLILESLKVRYMMYIIGRQQI